MTLWHVLEAFAAYAFLAVVFSALVLAVWINKFGDIPLLDGTPLQSALDDRDRARMVHAHDRDEETVCNAFAFALEEIRNLPEVTPWKRWLP